MALRQSGLPLVAAHGRPGPTHCWDSTLFLCQAAFTSPQKSMSDGWRFIKRAAPFIGFSVASLVGLTVIFNRKAELMNEKQGRGTISNKDFNLQREIDKLIDVDDRYEMIKVEKRRD